MVKNTNDNLNTHDFEYWSNTMEEDDDMTSKKKITMLFGSLKMYLKYGVKSTNFNKLSIILEGAIRIFL